MLLYKMRRGANKIDLVTEHVDSHRHRDHSAGGLSSDDPVACRIAPEEPIHRPAVFEYHRLRISVVPPVRKTA